MTYVPDESDSPRRGSIMNEELIEAMARGIAKADCGEAAEWPIYEQDAQAALAAIEAQGKVVVPVEPTFEMKTAGAAAITADHMRKMANYDAAADCWPAMLAASPHGGGA
jgi:hypothetical protein